MTVVVATRNRRDDLLRSLPRHEADVIVVDNGSSDDSVEVVRKIYPDITVVPLKHNVGAVARNTGVSLAPTPYVAFADDDSWWAPGSLRAAADLLDAHPGVALVGASILLGSTQRLDPVCEEMERSPLPADGGPGPALLGFVACASAVRRSAFLVTGGFDDVVIFPGEEERVALDLYESGWQLSYVPELTVHHHPSPKRDDDERRRTQILRSRLLTAVMRLPWQSVAAEAVCCVRSGSAGRSALRAAAGALPGALRRRRRISARTQRALRLLRQ